MNILAAAQLHSTVASAKCAKCGRIHEADACGMKSYGTSEGARKGWDTRGRGRHSQEDGDQTSGGGVPTVRGPNPYARVSGTLSHAGWDAEVTNTAGSAWTNRSYRGKILVRNDGRWLHIRSTPTSRGADGPRGKDGESLARYLATLQRIS